MPEPRHNWFRFSLRTLLVFVTLASAAFGWIGIKVREAQRQKEAVAAISKLGGVVEYDYQLDALGNFNPSAAPPAPMWLCNLLGEDFLADAKSVFLCGRRATDETLSEIGKLPQLESLNVSYTKISDDGLAHLANLTQLRDLRMSNTGVSDAGVAHLRGLKKLKELNLPKTQVTDASLRQMAEYPLLETLNVRKTQVTSAQLAQLCQTCPKLQASN